MKPWPLIVLALLVALETPPGRAVAAEPDSPPSTQLARADELVRQLGDESFDVRQQATEQLIQLGPAAEEALRRGAVDADPEVRQRCRVLLPRLQTARREARIKSFLGDPTLTRREDLTGWAQFARLAGDDAAARSLFAQVYRAEADLLELAEREPSSASVRLAASCRRLPVRLITPGVDATALNELVALLLLVGDPRLKVEPSTWTRLLEGLETFAERADLVKQLHNSPPARRLLLAVLQKERPSADVERALHLALALGLRESTPWAAAVAGQAGTPAGTRAVAVLLLGKLGDKGDLPRLQPLLADTAAVGKRSLGSSRLHAELRDVALAATIQLHGQDPADFGFPYLQTVPGLKVVPSPACLGFPDEASRGSAFKKWQGRATP